MKKRIVRAAVLVLLLLAGVVVCGSLYLLRYSLRPEATMESKEASSYKYMYAEYPFLQGWVDSLRARDALRDTTITGQEGERLHALYAWAPEPTDRTAVIVSGDNTDITSMEDLAGRHTASMKFPAAVPG